MGNKTPSAAITDEYVKADPVYVEKTIVSLTYLLHAHFLMLKSGLTNL